MRVRPKRSRSKIRVALVALLFAGCQAARDDASMSALHPDRAATIEAMASELREGDPWPAIREERIETTLPGAMDAAGVEAWLVLSRENNNDPIAVHVGGEDAGRLTAFLFVRAESGVDRVIVTSDSEGITVQERFPSARVATYAGQVGAYEAIAREVRAAGVETVAVNRSDLAAADGLSATQLGRLQAALGALWSDRLVSSEELIIRWLAAKIPSELELVRRAAVLTDLLEYELFEMVVPGETTNGDMHRWMRDRIEGLGLGHSWPTNPGITTGLDRGRGSDLQRVIRPGDLINIDAGIAVYDLWRTDLQRFAYILKPGEELPPDSIQYAWESARLSSRRMLEAMGPGQKGWEVDRVQVETQVERGSLPHWASTGHPVGYWTHDVGPRIGGYAADGPPPSGNAARELEPGMMFGYDGNYVWPATDAGISGTKSITIEEMGLVTPTGAEYMTEPQEELVLITAAGGVVRSER